MRTDALLNLLFRENVLRVFRNPPQKQSHFKWAQEKKDILGRLYVVHIYRMSRVLPLSLMSSGRRVSSKVEKLMKIDSVMENGNILQKISQVNFQHLSWTKCPTSKLIASLLGNDLICRSLLRTKLQFNKTWKNKILFSKLFDLHMVGIWLILNLQKLSEYLKSCW